MIEFELRGVPPLILNARLHWQVAEKQKLEWYGRVLVTIGKKRLRPAEPIRRAFVVYTRHCGYRRPDQTNLSSGVKWIEDALVYAGVLGGDDQSYVENVYEWAPASPKDKRISVSIAPIY